MTRMPGRIAATASARSAAETLVVSRSRPAQMSAIATASASARASANVREHRRGPMERERLVDRPDAPAGLALADRREGRDDRGRVMAVVVIHHDTGRLALALEATADTRERREAARDGRRGREPRVAAAPATARAFAALCRPAVGEPDGDRARQLVEAVDLEGGARLIRRR